MNRHLSTLACATALLATAGSVWAHEAHAGDGMRRVRADFEANGPGAVLDETSCDPEGRCLISYTFGAGALTGEADGEQVTHGVLFLDPATSEYAGSSYQLFTGSVDGCGDGTFVTQLAQFTGALDAPVVSKGIVLEGSGTGDFSGATGTVSYLFTPDGTTGRFNLKCAGS